MQMNLSAEDAAMLWSDVAGMAHDGPDPGIIPWIERLSPVSLENGIMTVSTRQNWTAKKIMGEFKPLIEELLHEITLEPIALNVVVDSPTFHVEPSANPVPASVATPAVIAPTSAPAPSAASPAAGPLTSKAAVSAPEPAYQPTPQPTGGTTVQATQRPSAAALVGAANRARLAGTASSEAAAAYAPGMTPAQALARANLATQEHAQEPDSERPEPVVLPEPVVPPVIDSRAMAQSECAPAATTCENDPGTRAIAPVASPVPILDDGAIPTSAITTGFTDFNFDTYIVGEANSIAYNMAQAVAEQPGSVPNPLFIWGPSGNGKTHLLLSILNYIGEHQHGLTARYVASNTFVEQYVDDIRNKKLKGREVLKEYRDIDVLLVDDVQFFEDKQESVTTFFDIFNQLMLDGKQIVLAADIPPDYLDLDDRMRTRFGMGLVVDIKAPTYEMKRSILKSFYERCRGRMQWCRTEIPDSLFDPMARLAPDNPRNMQGLITSLMIKADTDPSVLSLDGIKSAVNDLFKTTVAVSLDLIIKKVSNSYEVSVEDMKGQSRTRAISEARQIAMWMARQLTDESYEAIGEALGGRDHSTVYYSISKVEKKIEADKSYSCKLDRLRNEIVS